MQNGRQTAHQLLSNCQALPGLRLLLEEPVERLLMQPGAGCSTGVETASAIFGSRYGLSRHGVERIYANIVMQIVGSTQTSELSTVVLFSQLCSGQGVRFRSALVLSPAYAGMSKECKHTAGWAQWSRPACGAVSCLVRQRARRLGQRRCSRGEATCWSCQGQRACRL